MLLWCPSGRAIVIQRIHPIIKMEFNGNEHSRPGGMGAVLLELLSRNRFGGDTTLILS